MSNNSKVKLRPTTWHYPDPFDHARHQPWSRARSQAHFRGEEWLLSFDDFCILWDENTWPLRGRGSYDLTMARKDVEKGWSLDNCEIITRREFLQRSAKRRHGTL